MAYNFEAKKLTLIVIASREFVAQRSSSVPGAEDESWRLQIQR
jgi:hypothetical protein